MGTCRSGSGGEDLLALLAQLALRPDVPVERHGGDPEFAAECGHGRVAVRHRGLGQPHLGFRQRERPAAVAAARRVRVMTLRQLIRIMKGMHCPSLERAIALSEVLDIPLAELFKIKIKKRSVR